MGPVKALGNYEEREWQMVCTFLEAGTPLVRVSKTGTRKQRHFKISKDHTYLTWPDGRFSTHKCAYEHMQQILHMQQFLQKI